jgi:hypothetical protein
MRDPKQLADAWRHSTVGILAMVEVAVQRGQS